MKTEEFKRILEAVTNAPKSKGKIYLLNYLEGKKLSPKQAIIAHCCICMGYWYDGKMNCEIKYCPCYPFYPYKKRDAKKEKVSKT